MYGGGYYPEGTPGPVMVTAVVHCEECDTETDVDVRTELGATDLIPEACPRCSAPWPYDVLDSAEVYG